MGGCMSIHPKQAENQREKMPFPLDEAAFPAFCTPLPCLKKSKNMSPATINPEYPKSKSGCYFSVNPK
jgi:hypothetical protein